MSVVHQIVLWMVRSGARANHHRPAPLPSLRRVGRPNQQLRLRRNPYQTLLYRSNDRPISRAMLSENVFGLNGK
eukprot:9114774-Pyramimonas_sp.AAC.1